MLFFILGKAFFDSHQVFLATIPVDTASRNTYYCNNRQGDFARTSLWNFWLIANRILWILRTNTFDIVRITIVIVVIALSLLGRITCWFVTFFLGRITCVVFVTFFLGRITLSSAFFLSTFALDFLTLNS